jgi:hypothetical protein
VADSPPLLCTEAQFKTGGFADLVSGYSDQALTDALTEATRECEDQADRRLAPFTGLMETHRAEGMDPDEYSDAANLPMDLQGTLGRSYAYALGASTLVRHCWLDQFPPRYADLWAYSNVQVTIVRSYGGTENLTTATQITGPEQDSGHLWFQLGTFLPIGSLIRVAYGGGYRVAIPASLVRSCKFFAASIVVRELDPGSTDHNPDQLWADAMRWLKPFMRDGANDDRKGS